MCGEHGEDDWEDGEHFEGPECGSELEGTGVKQEADDITVKGVNYMWLEMHMCLVYSWRTPYF